MFDLSLHFPAFPIVARSFLPRTWEFSQFRRHQPAESFCRACLTGHYPTEIPADMRLSKLRFEAQPVEAG